MKPALVALGLGLAAAPSFAFQSVHVVNGGNGNALQLVIDAAASGDTVLVHGGDFDPIEIQGKSLTLVGEPALGTRVRELTIGGLAANQRCIVAGIDVFSAADDEGVVVQNALGSVRFEGVRSWSAQPSSVDAAAIVASTDVAWVGCTLLGGNQRPTPGPNLEPSFPVGRAAVVQGSQVAFYDCTLLGGDGQAAHFINTVFTTAPAGRGGSALECDASSTVFASRSTFTGGSGGLGRGLSCAHLPCGIPPTEGGNGGTGLVVAPGATAAVLDTTAQGGAGGQGGSGGMCCPQANWPNASPGAPGPAEQGPITHLAGAGTTMSAPSLVRAGNLLPLSIQGTPGDVVFLGFSTQTRFAFDPFYSGVFLFGPSARRASFGMIPGSGVLDVSIPVGSLPLGAQAAERFLQVLARDPLGQLRLGSPAWVTLLDPAF
jgi:hypothetical protein